ncbi:MAG: hypothetical protein J0665_09755 [Deltaproteobacteria bacterium]|nr:hypothetical protein [Deltaproteobacteria bacterium]
MTRTVAVLLCMLQLTCSAAAEPLAGSVTEIRTIFENELFNMAYTASSENEKHDEALKVAEQAVKARQADREWRRRAARSAELAGQNDLALAHWLFLSELGDGTARQSALRLSRRMNEFPVRRYLLEGMLLAGYDDPTLLKEYLTVSEAVGAASEAYDLLASRLTYSNRELLLQEQARLAELLGKPADAVNALDKLALIRPLTPDETIRRAKLMFGQGDLARAWQTSHGLEPDTKIQPDEPAEDFLPLHSAPETAQTAQEQHPTVPETRRSFNWNATSRRRAERHYFQIDPPAVGALVKYEINQDERTVSGQKSIDSSHTITERLDLATSGFVYHPALLQFSLKFSPEFRQSTQTKSELSDETSTNGTSFSPNYQTSAVFFGQKPYTLTSFAQHLEAQSWATYTGVTRTTTDSFGADLSLKYSLLPTTIGFSSSKSEQDGYFVTGSEWQEVHLLSRHSGITGDSSLSSSYSSNKQDTNGVANEIKTMNSSFSNQYKVTTDSRIHLATNLQLMSQESLNLQNDSLQISENLAWQHLENLRSQYTFNYRQFETGSTSTKWSSLDGRLTHKLYENLTTTAGGSGTLNSYSGGEEKALTALLNSAYQRRLGKWGTLNLNAGANYLHTTRKGVKGTAELSNEPHTLNSTAETFLDKSGINTDSIVVTNSAGTIIYVKDIDYRIDLIGNSVRISRLPLGAVTDGQLVLVSYSYTRDAGYDDSVFTQNYGISLELKRSLFLSYRYLQAKQTVLAGPPPERLSDTIIHLAAIRYVAGWSETGATIEDNDTTDISYRRWELTEAIVLQPSNWLQYNLRGYYGKTDYRSHEDSKKTFGATTSLNWTPLSWLRFEMEGYLEEADGTLEKTTNRGAKAGIGMNYRLWTVRLSHKLSEQDNETSDYKRSNQVMQIELSRTLW